MRYTKNNESIETLLGRRRQLPKTMASNAFNKIIKQYEEFLNPQISPTDKGSMSADRVAHKTSPDRFKGKSEETRRAIAEEEIVARACEDRLANSRLMKEFVSEMENTESGLEQKFSNFLGEAIDRLKKLFQQIFSTLSRSKEAQSLRKLTDRLEAIQTQFDALLEGRTAEPTSAQQKNTSDRGVMSAERRSGKTDFDQYASFEDQIKYVVDSNNISKNIYQGLLLGRTPKVWREVGLSDVPVMMDVSHTRENYFPKSEAYPNGKGLGKKLYQLPERIQNPIAIFASKTHPKDSVVALIELKDKNGNSVITPIEINGLSQNSGYQIKVNRIKTAFGKENAWKLLRDAVNAEMLGENTLFYWQKNKAISLAHASGVQFPTSVPNLDGFVHSISENKDLVNTKFLSQTETKQFKRWFGKSKAVNADGTPKILYHQTANVFTVFDTKRKGAGSSDNETPFGIFLKESDRDIGLKGKIQMPLYARIITPLVVQDRDKNGSFPINDTLIVSGTPQIWKSIGFNSLPVTINQTHVNYALNGTKDFDHHIGEILLKDLPNAIQKPIAIIQSQSKGHEDRAVVIFEMEHNAKKVISAIEVDGQGTMNNTNIDSNAMTTLFAKSNALTQLKNAIENTVNGGIQLFYWNKKEALSLLQKAGVQFSSPLPQDGFVHSVTEKGSKVKTKYSHVTDTQQFKRWFGKSKIVNTDGTPKLMYHGTRVENGQFYVFDESKAVKKGGLGLKALGKGNYFTAKKLIGTERYQ